VVRRTLISAGAAVLMIGISIGSVAAGGGNPAGTGQPGAECGEDGADLQPPGFLTDGFANAEAHYAGSEGTPSLAYANSPHAVSQYDIACVKYTASHS
jgi:hypothetical protein